MTSFVLVLALINSTGMEVEWTNKTIHFYGPVNLDSDTSYLTELNSCLDSLLSTIPLDAERNMSDVANQSREVDNYFQTALSYAQIVSTRYSTSGKVQNEYVISLVGPFIEEFIPRSSPSFNMRGGSEPNAMEEDAIPSIPNTGFVIDARGTGFRPGLLPRLLDADGNVLFDAGMVERGVINERGYLQYAYSPRQALETRELGLNPLRIVAEGAAGTNQCDLILPASATEEITGSALNMRLLSECRVMIIIDRQ
ncbi:hypothetical protein GF359_01540 [candidate division WOR-3 bacterium]|uniref:Uncharacterized protein n=1 Tax=candidate division WOR-3 bacterium TaxID=2052148 RepID=A0A9D5K7T8_UNCW3|nr:hypothetical protein [candidate division WOR-3 bacterium]MBD3363878.1 hypothetical protein [candidate division WOR-3 bacterium]